MQFQPPNQPQYPQQPEQYQQQQWQQQPYTPQVQQPPSQQPAPKKSRKKFFAIGCGGLAALIILIIAIAVAASGGSKSNNPSTTSQSTQPAQATQASTPAQSPKIGVPVVVNDTWTVTVNKVSTSQGTDFVTPQSGNIFLIVDVTLKNTSSAVQHASGLVQWSLQDSTGQKYNDDLALGTDPGGTVAAGGLVRGQLAFEVPKTTHNYTLQFVPDIGSNDLVQWNVSI